MNLHESQGHPNEYEHLYSLPKSTVVPSDATLEKEKEKEEEEEEEEEDEEEKETKKKERNKTGVRQKEGKTENYARKLYNNRVRNFATSKASWKSYGPFTVRQ